MSASRWSARASRQVFDLLEALKIGHVIALRRMNGHENQPDVLTVKDRINVEDLEWMRVVYKRLRDAVEGFNGRAKSQMVSERLTWQGLENVGIHVSVILMVVCAVAIAAFRIGRPELRKSIALFA